MNTGIRINDLNQVKEKLDTEIKNETVSINSINEMFSSLNSYVKETHENDLIVMQNDLIKASNNFKKNHDNCLTILEKNIQKYKNVSLQNKKIANDISEMR